jgi:HAE1 family hydrophobic/amphiphilic exporter-1
VTATLPGASADTMAASVAGIIERQLSTIAGISSMSSSSSQGTSAITIQFDLNRNIDAAALDVQTALTIAQAPVADRDDDPPSFRKVNPATSRCCSSRSARRRCPCRRSTNTATSPSGRRCRSFRRRAGPDLRHAKFRHSRPGRSRSRRGAGTVARRHQDAVSRANSSTPVGTLNGPKQDVALQASGQMDKAVDYSKVVVAWRNGSPVKLDEVAKIYDSVENDKIATWLDDERAIVLAIQKQPGRQYGRRGRFRAGETAGAARANSALGYDAT